MTDVAIRGSVSTAGAFVAWLVFVTVLPFVIAISPGSMPAVDATITMLALIHVPMTLYLLTDAEIRAMMARHPVALIGMPMVLFGVSVFVFVGLPDHQHFWYWLPVAIWQNWHFGKQNLGVHSMVRIAHVAGPMPTVERRLIAAGTVFGALAAYFGAQDLPGGDVHKHVGWLWAPLALQPIAAAGQFGLCAISIAYAIRARLAPASAVIFVLSVNFFLPFYLVEVSLPGMFVITHLAHGLQYFVFLGFHARASKWTLAAFVAIALLLAEIYFLHFIVPASWLNNTPLSLGLPMGILLAHFWFDARLWRLKNDESRAWVMNRYDFLFDR